MLSIKAGRAFRRESTSWVDPQPSKGLLALAPGDDGLLHFTWKNRETNNIEDDLIIIPGDASFVKVAESSSGRVFVLKFESSDQKHFYWVQDPSTAILERVEQNVNGLLQDPEFQPSWTVSFFTARGVPNQSPCLTRKLYLTRPFPSSSGSATSAPISATNDREMTLEPTQTAQPALSNDELSQSIAAQLRAMMQNRMGGSQMIQAQQPSVALSDILSPASLAPLFESANSGVLASLQDYLPSDLPMDPSSTPEETLRRVIQSGPFQSAVKQLDRAFATGLLGQLMPGFGLPEEAGLSVDAFLKAIHDKAEREHTEHSE